MRINIDITPEEYNDLKEIAYSYHTTVNRILSQFIADLTYSDNSGGSDERMYADDWLSRSVYNLAKFVY